MRSSDAPSGSHIREDIEVEGVLRIGSNCVCEGDLIATAGIILGDGVVVRGDLFTDGSVQVGHGCRIHGEIRPISEAAGRAKEDRPAPGPSAPEAEEASQASQQPAGAEAEGTAEASTPSDVQEELAPASPPPPEHPTGSTPSHNVRLEPSPELKSSALRSTLEALLMLAWDEPSQRTDETTPNRWGLKEDALEDLLEGAYALIADVYRDGRTKRPWPASDVVDLLLRQVAPLVVPTSVQPDGVDRVHVRVRRPPLLSRDGATAGWPEPTMALLEALLQTVRPSCQIDPADATQVLDRTADPEEVTLVVRTR